MKPAMHVKRVAVIADRLGVALHPVVGVADVVECMLDDHGVARKCFAKRVEGIKRIMQRFFILPGLVEGDAQILVDLGQFNEIDPVIPIPDDALIVLYTVLGLFCPPAQRAEQGLCLVKRRRVQAVWVTLL